MRSSRKLATVVVGVAIVAWPVATGTAVAADEAHETAAVVIGDRTYGPEDGIIVESGEIVLAGPVTGAAVLAETVYRRGTSYASTNHTTPISYLGKARAMANIYNGQRVIRAGFKYSRGGQDVIPWQYSNATVNSSCRWSAGPERWRTVGDSLDPNAPVTKFHYTFAYAPPQAC